MFGEEFWKQAVLAFTRLPMDSKRIKSRMRTSKLSDDQVAKDYLKVLEEEFPAGGGLDYLLMDACYDDEDQEEKDAFMGSMFKLWEKLKVCPGLPTEQVRKVETEHKKLRLMVEHKNDLLERIEIER